jgi:hypothetical protein
VVDAELIASDSVGDPRAVGMCAMNRETGEVVGVIVALSEPDAAGRRSFHVRSRRNPHAEYVMAPAPGAGGTLRARRCGSETARSAGTWISADAGDPPREPLPVFGGSTCEHGGPGSRRTPPVAGAAAP